MHALVQEYSVILYLESFLLPVIHTDVIICKCCAKMDNSTSGKWKEPSDVAIYSKYKQTL